MSESSAPAVYTFADLCRLFRASGPTVRKAVRDGTIPKPIRLGTKQVWARGPIDTLLGGRVGTAARVG